jgi:hypothetical protein
MTPGTELASDAPARVPQADPQFRDAVDIVPSFGSACGDYRHSVGIKSRGSSEWRVANGKRGRWHAWLSSPARSGRRCPKGG